MNKVVKVLAASVLMTMMVGCASMGGTAINQLKVQGDMSADGTGLVYGQMGGDSADKTLTKTVCAAIKNSDPKCNDDNYRILTVNSAFGYAAAWYGAFAWIPKNITFYQCSRLGDSDCTYAKVKLVEGKYAEFIEIASENKDGKCRWSGLPGAGGTVCPAYNWDYRKNLNDWDTTNGITTIKKKTSAVTKANNYSE